MCPHYNKISATYYSALSSSTVHSAKIFLRPWTQAHYHWVFRSSLSRTALNYKPIFRLPLNKPLMKDQLFWMTKVPVESLTFKVRPKYRFSFAASPLHLSCTILQSCHRGEISYQRPVLYLYHLCSQFWISPPLIADSFPTVFVNLCIFNLWINNWCVYTKHKHLINHP